MGEVQRMFANLIQKITVYETKESLIVLGSDEAETTYRVLLISRNDRKELVIHDEQRTFSLAEVREYLDKHKNKEQNRVKNGKMIFNKIGSGYSLAGFVRFTEGYYMILVTSRARVAMIGSHIIYKVEGTNMIYIPSDKVSRSEEQRYARLFENVDFSSNFYFSYDLTHTLQYNQTEIEKCSSSASPSYPGFSEVRQEPASQFVWNDYLLEPIRGHVHEDWIVYLIHGFLNQLSKWINQIKDDRYDCVWAAYLYNFNRPEVCPVCWYKVYEARQQPSGAYTSFVQLRGSIPLYWSQDLTKAMSKPPISLDFSDPYGGISSLHLRSLLERYGAPIIILSLVKRRERKKRESLLWEEFVQSIEFLNQFLQNENKIRYVAFDMARSNKKKGSNVLAHLDDITERCLEKTGFYIKNCIGQRDQRQHGIIRTNCVDCLDRTNTAQFAVGKHALGHQLNALGVTPTTELLFDTDCIRMLETLYEDQGDTIALQYGGSNLVHRVQSYRKTDMLTSHSNDILQTLSRYYSNSFSDAEKQQAFNVFLGVYRPYNEAIPLWDLPSDYYLHSRKQPHLRWNYSDWVDRRVLASLPQPYNEQHKPYAMVTRQLPLALNTFESVYRLHELTSFDNRHCFFTPYTLKSPQPKSANADQLLYDLSPFEVRKTVRWTNLLNQSSTTSSKDMGNSVFHTGSRTEEPDSSSSEESDIETRLTSSDEEQTETQPDQPSNYVSFLDILDDPFLHYEVDLDYTNKSSIKLYKHYQKLDEQLQPNTGEELQTVGPQMALMCKSIFPMDSEYNVIPPTVKRETQAFYKHVVNVSRYGAKAISKPNLHAYEKYVRSLRQ